jgi:hypothetical protein
MKKIQSIQAALLCMGMLSVSAAPAEMISKSDYKTGKTRISDVYKTEKAACKSLSGNAKDVCQEEAKAKEKVARAELEFSYTGKAADQNKILVVKAETAYEVAKERCDEQTGNAKDVCTQEAKATERKTLADLKMNKDISKAKKTHASEKMEADYKVAIEKCDALASEAKTGCVNSARARFGKK